MSLLNAERIVRRHSAAGRRAGPGDFSPSLTAGRARLHARRKRDGRQLHLQ